MWLDTAEPVHLGVFQPVLSLDELIESQDPRGDSIATPPSSHYDSVAADELHSAVRDFLSKLNSRDREVAVRTYWHDEPQTRIASDLGISQVAVSKALARIRIHGATALRNLQ